MAKRRGRRGNRGDQPMNTTAPTIRCTTASAIDDENASASDVDNPPEQAASHQADDIAAQGPMRAEVEIVTACEASVETTWLADRLTAAVGHLTRPVGQVTVTVVDDGRMRELNRRHRGTDETTDVLAFDLSAEGRPVETDIVVCADEAARRATELDDSVNGPVDHSVERELLLYALHGVLHCAGFDDHTRQGFDAMHAEEDRILSAIGVGATFSRPTSGHDDHWAGPEQRDGGSPP